MNSRIRRPLYISFKSWCCCSLPSVAPQQKYLYHLIHVFPSHALNKNPDKVIKARLITESFQIMHIFPPRPVKNGLSEQVKIQFLRICSLSFISDRHTRTAAPDLFSTFFYQSDGNKWVRKQLRFVLTLLSWILFPHYNIFKLVWLNHAVTCSYVDSCFS